MYKKISVFLIISFLISSNIVIAQNYSISGYVKSSDKKEPLVSATVKVLSNDKLIAGSFTDNNGKFEIHNLPNGKYVLSITYVGFKSFKTNIEINDKSLTLNTYYLIPSSVELNEVTVEGKAQPVVQNKDTTEFNAVAFKVNKDANADELVSKLPGVTVEDGKVTAHGEEVKNVYVDGKQFFGNDPNAVLRNIPAEIIDKIQLFDKASEQAEFTGFDDGNKSKTMNIVTKVRYRNGIFGRINAGAGTEEKYMGNGTINFFNNEQRITLIGQINNINEQNFSIDDIMGIFSGGGGGRRIGFMRPGAMVFTGPMGGFGGRMGGGFGGGRELSNFMVNPRDGLTTTKAFGLNYNDEFSGGFEVMGSYFFNKTDNEALTKLDRVYYQVSGIDQQYSENNSSSSDNINHRVNLRVNYQIDTLNSFLIMPRLSFQGNDGSTRMSGKTFSSIKDINFTDNYSGSNLSAYDGATEILYRHRFFTRGRTISARLNFSYNSNNGDNNLYSFTNYYDNIINSDTTDQIGKLDKTTNSIDANLVYTEPISDNSQLQLMGSLSFSKSESDLKNFSKDFISKQYNILDTSLSNLYTKKYNTKSVSVGYAYRTESFLFLTGLSYNYATLENDQVFPFNNNLAKNFTSFLPYFTFRYGQRRVNELMLDYRVSNNAPGVEQLQNVLDNSNPLQLSIGNPFLKQDTRHSISLRYSTTNQDNYSSLFVLFGGTITQDYIAYEKIIAVKDTIIRGILLNPGVQLQTPVNLDGYKNFRSMATYSTPIDFLYSNFNLNVSYNFSNTPVIQNGVQGNTKSSSISLGVVLSSNISEDIDFSISHTNIFNNIKTDFRQTGKSNYFSQRTKVRFYYNIFDGFIFQTDFDYKYDGGLSGGSNPNSYLWSANIRQKFLKNDRGEIKLAVYDILKKNSNLNRRVTDTYYEDTNTNVLGRFYILSISYQVRSFGL